MQRILVGLFKKPVNCLTGAKAGLNFVKGFMTMMTAATQPMALAA
jgi:hypothetical protein